MGGKVQATVVNGSPPGTFEDFYGAHVQALTLQLYAYTGDLGDAQDVTQEAFCRAFARWDRLSSYDDPVAWVRRVAWNLATTRWRRHRVASVFLRSQRERHVEGPSPDRVALVGALAVLPANQRRVFVLHYLADMSIVDIAAQEGIAEGTVKSTLHRARAALADRLEDLRKERRNV
jgi:RNA polymerase sigma-70 factor (ECF subfamily)